MTTTFASSSADIPTRPLKRQYTALTDSQYFAPAATSFRPRPYQPANSNASIPHRKPSPVPQHVNAPTLPPADPTPEDPNAVFIRPPFIDFPNAHLYPDGLTYNAMAFNPEWFLDPADFASPTNSNPEAIPYPTALEPPRGWCGSVKKKDAKEKSTDAWPEGEEPRLRCTFCRRTYAGINAKSMWRRHVFEKHKIAMSNRRDGPERSRSGRGSNKENRSLGLSKSFSDVEKCTPMFAGSSSDNASKSYYRPFHVYTNAVNPANLVEPTKKVRSFYSQDQQPELLGAPIIPQGQFQPPLFADYENQQTPLDLEITTPITSPHVNTSLGLLPSSPPATSSPNGFPLRIFPVSPYDPTVTPAFKHSPPHLPCEQPWRFPSPSHPLHTSPEELCLGVPVGGITGEGLDSKYLPVNSSPLAPNGSSSLPPSGSSPFVHKVSPLKMATNRVVQYDWRRSVSESDMSPLRGITKNMRRPLSGPLSAPLPGAEFSPHVDGNVLLPADSGDPFAVWCDFSGPAVIQREATAFNYCGGGGTSYPDSPVIRTVDLPEQTSSFSELAGWNRQPSGVGLGISIPWTYSPTDVATEDDVEGELQYPHSAHDGFGSDETGADSYEDGHDIAPPLKRRRTTDRW